MLLPSMPGPAGFASERKPFTGRPACHPKIIEPGAGGKEGGEAFGDNELVRLGEEVEQGRGMDEADATEERSEGP